MTLNEAIKHCEEKIDCTKCGMQYKQLANWLKELKIFRENNDIEKCILYLRRNGYIVKNELRICRKILMNVLNLMKKGKVKTVANVHVRFV